MFYCQLMPLLRKISSFETMFLDSLCVWSFSVFSLLSLKWFFLSSQSNWDWFQLSGQLIPLLPAHCCLRLLGFHSCCLHQDWDCCWNYTTYIFLRDWIQKKRKIVWGCLERWSCPWCWILSPGILETLVIHTARLNYTVWSQQLKNLYVRGHESSDMRNRVQGHEI